MEGKEKKMSPKPIPVGRLRGSRKSSKRRQKPVKRILNFSNGLPQEKNTPRPQHRLGEVDRWITEAFTKMGASELIGKIPWEWNSRFTRVMGRAKFRRVNGKICPVKMEFSTNLFECATSVERRQTVFHECAHIVDGHRGTYSSKKAHGPSWKRIMRRAGVPAKRCHNVVGPKSVKNKFPAKCACTTHMISKTIRNRILGGGKYKCRKCRTNIALTK